MPGRPIPTGFDTAVEGWELVEVDRATAPNAPQALSEEAMTRSVSGHATRRTGRSRQWLLGATGVRRRLILALCPHLTL
jgi:hypothetical protein